MKSVGFLILVLLSALHVSAQPRVEHKVNPSYPSLAWQAGLQGTIAVEVALGLNGNVVSAKASGAEERLQRAVEENIRQWTFSEV
jgi:TonB family protein